jgi:hypothetical protein
MVLYSFYFVSLIVAVAWVIYARDYEPMLAVLAALGALLEKLSRDNWRDFHGVVAWILNSRGGLLRFILPLTISFWIGWFAHHLIKQPADLSLHTQMQKDLRERTSEIETLKSQLQLSTKTRSPSIEDIFGSYQWQWAGENWIGKVTIERKENGASARIKLGVITVKKIMKNGKTATFNDAKPHFASTSDGRVTLNKEGKFSLFMPIQHAHLPMEQKRDQRLVLEAELSPVVAFAGTVKYQFDDDTSTGDLILIGYQPDLIDRYLKQGTR